MLITSWVSVWFEALFIGWALSARPVVLRDPSESGGGAAAYVRSSDVLYYRDKRDSMKAITITDRGNALRGFIVLLKERIGEPVELEQMWIPYLYIEPRARGQGLARRLLHAAMDDARNENVRQLIFLSSKSESYPFWHKNGFSAFLWSHLAERNTALAAGILV